MTTRVQDLLLEGDHASRPAATAVPNGALYACSDHGLVYQSDGATWGTWATLGGLDSVVAGTNVTVDATDPRNPVVSASGGGGATFVGAQAVKSTSQTLTNGVNAAVAFPAADLYDTDSIHDPATNNTRMTIPTGMGGVWRFSSTVVFASSAVTATTNHRTVLYAVNGVNTNCGWNRVLAPSGTACSVTTTADLDVSAGDYVETMAGQGSGGNLDVTAAHFSAHYLGAP